ncbi:MAG: hypothetical protein ACLSVD_11270, partial [Eggerthellaceae bacterium]
MASDVVDAFMVLLYHISVGLEPSKPRTGIILSGIDKPDGSASNPCCSARVDRSGAGIALKRIRLRVTELYL